MRAPAISPASLPLRWVLALAALLLAATLTGASAMADEPQPQSTDDVPLAGALGASEGQPSDPVDGATLAAYLASGELRLSADVPLTDEVAEPVVGSFTVDGLTYAVVGEGEVALVAVSPATLAGSLTDGSAEGSHDGSAGAEEAGRGIGSGWTTSPQPLPAPSAEASGSGKADGESDDALASAPLSLPVAVPYDGVSYSLVAVGSRALSGCDAATVVLPASLVSIDEAAFRDSSVQAIEVAEGNPTYSSYDGMLFDADKKSLLLIPEGKQGAARIPKEAVSVPPDALSHSASVTSVSVEAGSAAYLSRNGCLYDASGETLLWNPMPTLDSQSEDSFKASLNERSLARQGNPDFANIGIDVACLPEGAGTVVVDSAINWSFNSGNGNLSISNSWHTTHLSQDDMSIIVRPKSGNATASIGNKSATFTFEAKTGYKYRTVESDGLPTIGSTLDGYPAKRWSIIFWFDPIVCTVTLDNDAFTANDRTTYYMKYGAGLYKDAACTQSQGRSLAYGSKTGHKFKGWSRAADSDSFVTNSSGTFYNDDGWTKTFGNSTSATLYAKWDPIVCTVTLDNDALAPSAQRTYYMKYGVGLFEDAACTQSHGSNLAYGTKTGHKFKGWYLNKNGDTYTDLQTNDSGTFYGGDNWNKRLGNNTSVTLYARWDPIVCTVTLVNDADESDLQETYYMKYGAGLYKDAECTQSQGRLISPGTKTGHRFDGWRLDNRDGSTMTNTTGTFYGEDGAWTKKFGDSTSATLVARWDPIVCTITLDNEWHNDKAVLAPDRKSTVYMKYGVGLYSDESCTQLLARTLAMPKRPGYTFAGYGSTTDKNDLTNSSGTFWPADWTRMFRDNTTYHAYALWEKNKIYRITIDLNPPCDDTDGETGVVTKEGDKTFYQWTGRGFYREENPSDTNESVSIIEVPVRTGYTFLGCSGTPKSGTWLVNAGGKLIHVDGTLVSEIKNPPMENTLFKGDQTIYARWEPGVYEMTLDNQATALTQEPEPASVWVKYNTGKFANKECTTPLGTSLAKTPMRVGHAFKGYWTGTDGTGDLVIDEAGILQDCFTDTRGAATTFYAQWEENECTWDLKLEDADHTKIKLIRFYYANADLSLDKEYASRHLFWQGYAGSFTGNSYGTFAVTINGTNYGEEGKLEFSPGYELGGWKQEGVDTDPVAARGATWDDGNRTFWACTKARTYEVTFDRFHGGGTAEQPSKGDPGRVTATYDADMPSIPASVGWPVRPGYAFSGWYDGYDPATAKRYYRPVAGSSGEELLESDARWDRHDWNERQGATEREQLRAGWDANAYRVAFDAAGGSWEGAEELEPAAAEFDQDVELAAAPERAGYHFDGWEATGPDGVAYVLAAGSTLPKGKLADGVPLSYGEAAVEGQEPATTVTLTAQWVADLRVDVPIRVDMALLVNWGTGQVELVGPGGEGDGHATGEFRSHSSGEMQVSAVGHLCNVGGTRLAALDAFCRGDEAKAANLERVRLAFSADAEGAPEASASLADLYEGVNAPRPPAPGEDLDHAMASRLGLETLGLVIPAASGAGEPGTLKVRYGIDCEGLPLEDVAIDPSVTYPIAKLMYEVRLANP